MNCIKCDVELTDENWTICQQHRGWRRCKKCINEYHKKQQMKKPWIHKFIDIKYNAHRKKYEWNIPTDVGYRLITSSCAYCGKIPKELNGLDRVDSSKGYTIDNVVSCCKHCNWAKNSMTTDEFKKHIEEIYHYLIEK